MDLNHILGGWLRKGWEFLLLVGGGGGLREITGF